MRELFLPHPVVDQYISRSPALLEAKWCRTVKYAGITGGTLKHLIYVRVSVTCSFHTFTTTRIFIRPWLHFYIRMGISTRPKSKTIEKMQALPVLKDGKWRKEIASDGVEVIRLFSVPFGSNDTAVYPPPTSPPKAGSLALVPNCWKGWIIRFHTIGILLFSIFVKNLLLSKCT